MDPEEVLRQAAAEVFRVPGDTPFDALSSHLQLDTEAEDALEDFIATTAGLSARSLDLEELILYAKRFEDEQ